VARADLRASGRVSDPTGPPVRAQDGQQLPLRPQGRAARVQASRPARPCHLRDLDRPTTCTGRDPAAGRHVEADELELLFKYLGTLETASGARDRATFALLRGTGIRRAEAASLDLAAYAPFRSQLTVEHGKGRKERVVILPEWVISEVDEWLDWRGHDSGPLLCAVDKHDNLYPRHRLHPDTLWERFVAHVEAAGVEHFTPHDLRRTFAGDLLEAGHDLVKVQWAMGHSDPSQTARYDRRGLEVRRDMGASIPAPGGGR
jgi:integrase